MKEKPVERISPSVPILNGEAASSGDGGIMSLSARGDV